MFYLMMHSIDFLYGYMASDIIVVNDHSVTEETCCSYYLDYSFQLAARVLLYTPFHWIAYIMEHWLKQERAQWSTMKDRSNNPLHHE